MALLKLECAFILFQRVNILFQEMNNTTKTIQGRVIEEFISNHTLIPYHTYCFTFGLFLNAVSCFSPVISQGVNLLPLLLFKE